MQRRVLPQNLKEVLLVSRYITLYLVDSKPPNLFTFVDPLNNYFKVCIDRKISCSCQPGNNDHCMHTFYVLIKIYHISEDDPLVFQKQYSETELQKIFSGEHSKNWTGSIKKKDIEKEGKKVEQLPKKAKEEEVSELIQQQQKPKVEQPSQQQSKISLPTILSTKVAQKAIRKQEYQQPKLQKGSVCSICYQSLLNETPLIKCPTQCFNYFHIKCLKFWVDYQKRQELSISCPMCRGKLPENVHEVLKKSQNDFIKHYKSFEVDCCECKQQINIKLFRCLLCKHSDVCQDCYFGWKHLNHDRYLMKKSKKAEWSCPEVRIQASMAKLDISLKYVKQFKNQQEMKILFGQNYSKFLEANLKKQSLLEYLINSFSSVSKEIFKTYKKLDYQQKDIKCMLCKKGKVTEMRRLNCKHFIDEKCLSFLLVNGQRCCPYDKQLFLQSFQDLSLKISKK